MAIRRAGPFASFSDSFLDEPATANFNTVPVNCARDTSSSNWVWKCFKQKTEITNIGTSVTNEYVEGFPSGSASITASTGNSQASTLVRWRSQAVDDFDVDFTYSGSITGIINGVSSARVKIDGVEIFADQQNDSDPLGGSTTFTVPASVVPSLVEVTVGTSGGGGAAKDMSVSYTLS